MPRDLLFLLKPDFMDHGKGPYYCPGCATLEGLLSLYPRLRQAIEVRYVDFPRPREDVIAIIGASNQGLPALVIGPGVKVEVLEGLDVGEANGRRFLHNATDIGRYLARTQGIGEPH